METAKLAPNFRPAVAFQREREFHLLPFKFTLLDDQRYVATNLGSDYAVLSREDLQGVLARNTDLPPRLIKTLKARQFIYSGDPSLAIELTANQIRTKQAPVSEFTSLHIFVVTLRCDHSCQYCQVSRVSEDRFQFDLTEEAAEKAIHLMLKSPSQRLKVEFQGGEPLLNFKLIKFIVDRTRALGGDRDIQFVIASNLVFLTPEILNFCRQHRIVFSCSLDGPAVLHNKNRPRQGHDSHSKTLEGITMIRETLGDDAVAALMTTTQESLQQPEAIIDEYVRLGFRSIFLRWISPFGFASRSHKKIGYAASDFLFFYKRGLEYILSLNSTGTPLREEYAALILRKILTPYGTGYVDLQSPAGLGLSVMIYNYNGDVYASDEGRMLAEMNDYTFRLGNVDSNSYEDLFLKSGILNILTDTQVEGLPGCADCAFSPYCGTDPVFNHATQGDWIGHRPTSEFCQRNMSIFRHLFQLLEANDEKAAILKSWASQ